MMLMADTYGADIRLVAFMQYLRLVIVTLFASLVARVFVSQGPMSGIDWFPAISWSGFVATLALATIGVVAGRALKIPAGPLLLPIALAAALQAFSSIKIELPTWLLASSYASLGWHIGLGFSPATLDHVARAFTKGCYFDSRADFDLWRLGFLLTRLAGVDALSAYLATSPGGADTIAIIAASANVDLAFVMAMQTFRLVLVILISPALCRIVVRHIDHAV